MLIASLLALVLAAEPEAPVQTRDPEIPASAPTDDYGFVAWCHGALSGHMELRDLVRPELDSLSPPPPDDDAMQREAGEEYLDLYTAALRAAERASSTNLQERGRTAAARGYGIWTAARTAEPRTRMWSYLMWELPPRCEITARRLEERSDLFAEAFGGGVGQTDDLGPVASGEPATPSPGEAPPEEPQPEPSPPSLRGPQ